MAHPTMDDVARRAGVSRALVSLVMNDSPNVSAERRRTVQQAAADLGYRRNAVARQLASRRTGTIGILLNDLHNPFFADIYDGISAGTRKMRLQPLLTAGSLRPSDERDAVEVMLEHRVDGMILVSPRLASPAIAAAASVVPVVVIGRVVRQTGVDSVTNDESHGSHVAVEHLVSLGHRDIAHVHGGAGAGAQARRRGYERAMRSFGLEPDVVAGDFTEIAGARAAGRLLARRHRPTALFAANDLAAAGAIDTFESAGLDVPGDMSVVGYDNTFLAKLHHIGLTSVDQSTQEMGGIAVSVLHERIEGNRAPSIVRLVTPALVARRTSGPRNGQ